MGVRPSITHIIGTRFEDKDNLQTLRNFYNEYYEENFFDTVKHLFNEIGEEDMEFAKSMLGDKMVGDLIYLPNSSLINVFGLIPPYHYHEAKLYNHDLIWSMIQAQMIEDKPKESLIPYNDYSDSIGLEPKEIVARYGLNLSQELIQYKGKWGRKYQHSPIYLYDMDFDFTLAFLKHIGYSVEAKDLQRYTVFEWA